MHWIDDENKKRYDIKFKIIFNNENIENILLAYKNNIPSNKHKIITDKIYNIINSKYDNSYLFYKSRRSNSIISNNELNNNQTNSNTISNMVKNLSRTYSYTTEKYYEQYCKLGKKPSICRNYQKGGEQNSYITYLEIEEIINNEEKLIFRHNKLQNINKDNIKSLELLIIIINSFNLSYNEILYKNIIEELDRSFNINKIDNIIYKENINIY